MTYGRNRQIKFRTSQDRHYVDARLAHEVKGAEPDDGGGNVNRHEDVPIILEHLFEFRHDTRLLLLKDREGSNQKFQYNLNIYQKECFLQTSHHDILEPASLVNVHILWFVRGELTAVIRRCQLRD